MCVSLVDLILFFQQHQVDLIPSIVELEAGGENTMALATSLMKKTSCIIKSNPGTKQLYNSMLYVYHFIEGNSMYYVNCSSTLLFNR